MIPIATGEPRGTSGALVAEGQGLTSSEAVGKKHFDAFETDFFQQGDDTASLQADSYLLDDLDSGARGKRLLLSRPSLFGLTLVSAGLAIVACVALWRSNAPLAAPAFVAHSPARPALAARTPTVSAALPLAVPGLVQTEPPSPSTVVKAVVEPMVPADQPMPSSAAEPQTEAEEKVVGAATPPAREDEADATGTPPSQGTHIDERCLEAVRTKRSKKILALCPATFGESGGDANVAVALAKAELDRGHFAQANAWSRRAIAIAPDSAEAYVFAGGAEQGQGHRKAAKEAYLHYLRLAPSGRFATELRTILRSL